MLCPTYVAGTLLVQWDPGPVTDMLPSLLLSMVDDPVSLDGEPVGRERETERLSLWERLEFATAVVPRLWPRDGEHPVLCTERTRMRTPAPRALPRTGLAAGGWICFYCLFVLWDLGGRGVLQLCMSAVYG